MAVVPTLGHWAPTHLELKALGFLNVTEIDRSVTFLPGWESCPPQCYEQHFV